MNRVISEIASRATGWVILGFLGLVFAAPVAAQDAWPAEPVDASTNLTAIEGPGENDFHSDLSAAVWNSVTRTLWLGRNGPRGNSKLWAVVEDGTGSFQIDSRDGMRGEWTNWVDQNGVAQSFGDLEGVTQADFSEDVVYLMIEGEERIKEYDVSIYGTATQENDWNTRSILPRDGGAGAEGITFVPDSALLAAGFVDQNGAPYTSTQGMGGLMFVGHQNGGAVFVFDLSRDTEPGGESSFLFVGRYETGPADTSALEFDRSTGLLYIYHDKGIDVLSVSDLASTPVSQGVRQLNIINSYDGPSNENNEGIAVFPANECVGGERSFFMTIDDGEDTSLSWYKGFTDGCSTGNTAPTANPDGFTVAEGGTATVLTGGALSVLDDDSDPEGDPLTAVLIGNPSNGTVALATDGTFSYVHNGSETTSDSFEYQANDSVLNSIPVTVSISITPVNDPPVAAGDAIQVDEGGTAIMLIDGATSVLDNDTDAEEDLLSGILVEDASNGTVMLMPDGSFIYTHDGGVSLVDSFSYRASDGTDESAITTVSVIVSPVIAAVPSMGMLSLIALAAALLGFGVFERPRNLR